MRFFVSVESLGTNWIYPRVYTYVWVAENIVSPISKQDGDDINTPVQTTVWLGLQCDPTIQIAKDSVYDQL